MPEGCRTALIYGDSNTHGTCPKRQRQDRARFSADRRWTGVMAAELSGRWRVIEEGLPGRTTAHPDPERGALRNGLALLPVVLESHLPIDLVVLMLGTNDLKSQFALSPADVVRSVEQLVDCLRQSKAGPDDQAPAVLLVAPPRVVETGCLAETFKGAAKKSQRLSAGLADLARTYGLPFVDAAALVEPSPVDGVHLDCEAHQVLGRALSKAVAGL